MRKSKIKHKFTMNKRKMYKKKGTMRKRKMRKQKGGNDSGFLGLGKGFLIKD